ncbi:Short-chain dehydrogenase/reductase SDR [Minicystis rosea]|nr:Short-chain dehydrogenase/reductase SDR [Minicystis rosea]
MAHVVFITGASSGFGAAIARRFAKDGARLVLCARRGDRLEALAHELGVPTHTLMLDVRDRAAVEGAIRALPAELAAITILVNNAGGALGLEPAQSANLDDWDTMVDTNCKGLMYVTRAILPGMVERDRGHVINLGSVAGTYPYPGGNVYGATKAFVEQFSLNLRADLTGKRVRVTNIEPGMAETEFSVVRFKGDEEKAKAVYQGFPPLRPEDVADAVHWCATVPEHVNVNRLELMSVMQSFAGFAVKRG